MERRYNEGKLTRSTLIERACRVLSLKEQLGLIAADSSQVRDREQPDRKAISRLAERAVAESLTLVRDRPALIPFPLNPGTRILHVVIMNYHNRYTELYERIKYELEQYSDHVDQWIDPGPGELFTAALPGTYDLILCSIGSRQDYGLNVTRLHGEVARNMMGDGPSSVPRLFLYPISIRLFIKNSTRP